MLVLMMMLTLSVNGAIEINVFLSSAQASVNTRVAAQIRCEYTLNVKSVSFEFKLILLAR